VPRAAPRVACYAISVFNVEDARRLTGDVLSQHLIRPIHSAGRRCDYSVFNAPSLYSSSRQRLGYPADGVPVQTDGMWRTATCSVLMMTRSLPRKLPLHANATQITNIRAQGRLHWGRALVVPSITSVMSLGPHVGAQHPCMCPLDYKREGTLRYKRGRYIPKSSKTQLKLTSNTTHSGVGYYAPAARTTLNPCVFLCSSPNLTSSRTLRPLLISGFRAGALRHPARDFLSDRGPT
jgi:hypothetical protein